MKPSSPCPGHKGHQVPGEVLPGSSSANGKGESRARPATQEARRCGSEKELWN